MDARIPVTDVVRRPTHLPPHSTEGNHAVASSSGDRITIRVGGNASGPIVVGDRNRVEAHQPGPDPAAPPAGAPDPGPDPGPEPSGRTQTNTADGHASLYTVMNGDMHVHHDDGPDAAEPAQA